MTLEQLRIFVAVAERQHLTQAAQALSLTPSAVSASIKALEQRYGIPLFNRVGRRIELSEAGGIFLQEAKATLASARAAELTLAELGGLQRGTLSLQASQTIASYWLPPLLVAFRLAYPQIVLELGVGNTQQVAQAVLDGAADLGFIEGSINEEALEQSTVGDDRIVAVVAPDHPWADGRALTAADLREATWIMREPGSGTRSVFEATMHALGVNIAAQRIALTLPSNEALRAAVMAGPYAAAVSELVVATQLQAGLLCKANLALAPRPFYLLRHRERYKSKASLALEQLIRRGQATA